MSAPAARVADSGGFFLPLQARRAAIGSLALCSLLVSILVLVSVFGDATASSVAIVFFIHLIAVIGIGVYTGNTGIVSFGHTAFMAIGAYTSAILTLPTTTKQYQLTALPDWLASIQTDLVTALFAAVAISVVVAAVIGLVIARMVDAAASIATLGLLVIVYTVLNAARDVTRGSQALFGFETIGSLWFVGLLGCLAVLVARSFGATRVGLRAMAAREDAPAASAVGVNVVRTRFFCWVVSAGLMGLSGALLGHYLGVISPRAFYFGLAFSLLAMLICGGMRTVTGAVLGALVISLLSEVLRRMEGGVDLAIFEVPEIFGLTKIGIAAAILFFMYRLPNGLAGRVEIEMMVPFLRRLSAAGAGREVPTPHHTLRLAEAVTSTEPRLTVERVTKRFGGVVANSDVSLSVSPGQIVGILGANGAGKSTLLAMIGGSLPADQGEIVLNGVSITKAPPHHRARLGLARTFQNIRLFGGLSVWENVYCAALAGRPGEVEPKAPDAEALTRSLLGAFGLMDRADQAAGALEYGAQRRVEIARALALRPSLLLLDEPAAGMNPDETEALGDALLELRDTHDLSIVLVEHDIALVARLSDTMIVLEKGEVIASGDPDAVLRDPKVIESYVGTSVETGLPDPQFADVTADTEEHAPKTAPEGEGDRT
ncbi:MAG: branched-chain amino acid ABC transporter ATP-binding protein/permease [Pseudomonadota bacterium]